MDLKLPPLSVVDRVIGHDTGPVDTMLVLVHATGFCKEVWGPGAWGAVLPACRRPTTSVAAELVVMVVGR